MVVRRGGLQPRRRAKGLPGYDTAFAMDVAGALGLAGQSPTVAELRSSRTTVETLLNALLQASQPWARMMTEILAMFERAGAAAGTDSITIELSLSKLDPPLAQSLSQFRSQAAAAVSVIAQAPGTNWSALDLWGLRAGGGDLWTLRRLGREIAASPMMAWADQYRDWPREVPGGRESPPDFSASGHPVLDHELSRLRRLLESFAAAARTWAPTYEERMASWRSLGPEEDIPLTGGWTAQRLGGPESDLFPGQIAESFERLVLDPDLDGERAQTLALELRAKLDAAPPGPSVESLVQQYLDLLDLPAWKKRNELYSVWISSLIAEALPEPRRWEVVNGTLSYAFGGAKLLTGSIGPSGFELWAEHRAPLPPGGSGKRSKGVQPDYTLLLMPAGSAPLGAMVVECKQYHVPSRLNFRNALQDYALAHAMAPVLLANYGPVPAGLADGLSNASDLVAGFGGVHPGGGGLTDFKEALGRAMNAVAFVEEMLRREADRRTEVAAPAPDNDAAADPAAGTGGDCIWLEWDSDADLDLHIFYRGTTAEPEISFRNRGDIAKYPHMQLDRDITRGPGRETVWIARWLAGRYEVAVERFRGDWPERFEVGLRVGGVEQRFTVSAPSDSRVTVLTLDGNAPELPYRS